MTSFCLLRIVVQPDGPLAAFCFCARRVRRVSLHRFGDIGHLPLDMVTFH